ncbi:hypothetical protein [Bacillus pseudomycoides]|uniref:hypothetical protein n=1 Tax=Bacillus pseudomycoides TaxID=64104 RepID=UPI001FB4C485|nr:hypothetical protein [Bacillus pseudomycoides]
MNIKKIVISIIALFAFIFFAAIVNFLYFSSVSKENKDIQEYIKGKYGIDVIVTKRGSSNEVNLGHTWHTVQVKDNKNIQFRVEVTGFFFSTIIGDEYEYGRKTYEEYKEFKPLLKEIEMLGYTPVSDENVIQYIIDDSEVEIEDSKIDEERPTNELLLTLKTIPKLDYSQFETKELDRLFALLQLVQGNNKQITKIEILDSKDKLHGFHLENIQQITSKDQLLSVMKNESEEYWTYLIRTQIHDKIKEVENERVAFKDISCSYIENGECKGYEATLEFKNNTLQYKKNPQLIDDIYKVISLLQAEKPNKTITMEFINTGKSSYAKVFHFDTLQTREHIETIVKKYLVEGPYKY